MNNKNTPMAWGILGVLGALRWKPGTKARYMLHHTPQGRERTSTTECLLCARNFMDIISLTVILMFAPSHMPTDTGLGRGPVEGKSKLSFALLGN